MPDKSVTVSPADVAKVIAAKLAAKRTAENVAKIRRACGHDDNVTLQFPNFPPIKGIGPVITAKESHDV